MAEKINDDANISVTSAPTRNSGASKLSLLIAFVAGAAASWIVITANIFG